MDSLVYESWLLNHNYFLFAYSNTGNLYGEITIDKSSYRK